VAEPVALTAADHDAARLLAASRPVYRGSHRKGAANEVGCLGEVVVARVLAGSGLHLRPVFATTHDYAFPNGWTVEVKTKDRTVAPRPGFDCSVPEYVEGHQTPDFYVFVSLQRDPRHATGMERFHTAHLVGVGSPTLLARHGHYKDRGHTDPNGTTFWTACHNVPISRLVPLASAVAYWSAVGVNAPRTPAVARR
jgi:hypothetical protein